MQANQGRNLQIESLRAFAISFVLLAHLLIDSSEWAFDLFDYFSFGIGVELFFVVSGYLLTQQLRTRLARRQHGRVWPELKAFWLRRIFRLLPAAWLWLLLPLGLFALLPAHPMINLESLARDALAAFLHVYNVYLSHCFAQKLPPSCSPVGIFNPYWSLSLEEQFYLLMPLALIAFSRRWLLLIVSCILVGSSFWLRGFLSYGHLLCFDVLLWGAALALVGPSAFSSLSGWIRRWRIGPALSLGLLVLMLWQAKRGGGVTIGYGISTIATTALCSAVLVWLALNDNGITPKRVMQWVASRSYALYLAHMPMYCMCKLLIIPDRFGLRVPLSSAQEVFYIVAALITSALAAELTYRFVETPLREYGRKMANRVAKEQSASAEAQSHFAAP